MTNTRTDVHRPASLITEDYEYVTSFDTQEGIAHKPESYVTWRNEIFSKVFATNDERGMNQCHHCGARMRYTAVLKHVPTGDYIAVGETCLDNRFELATADFHRIRKAAELDRAAQRIVKACNEFVAAHPEIAFLLNPLPDYAPHFVHDVKRKFRQYGDISLRQMEAVVRVMAEIEAKQAAPVVVEETAPVVEGRIVVTGTVLSTKWQDNDFGGSLKMLVKDARNFKVWGTVPSSVEVRKGDTITFTATVTKSDNDEAFGFFKRPSKATVTPQEG